MIDLIILLKNGGYELYLCFFECRNMNIDDWYF